MKYVVYTELFDSNKSGSELWYYGCFEDKNKANEVALSLGNEWPAFHCVCLASEARNFGVRNLPAYID